MRFTKSNKFLPESYIVTRNQFIAQIYQFQEQTWLPQFINHPLQIKTLTSHVMSVIFDNNYPSCYRISVIPDILKTIPLNVCHYRYSFLLTMWAEFWSHCDSQCQMTFEFFSQSIQILITIFWERGHSSAKKIVQWKKHCKNVNFGLFTYESQSGTEKQTER